MLFAKETEELMIKLENDQKAVNEVAAIVSAEEENELFDVNKLIKPKRGNKGRGEKSEQEKG